MSSLEVRVSLRAPDGTVRSRERWCWTRSPSAGEVLSRLAHMALAARRAGLTLHVEDAPDAVRLLIASQGLGAAIRS